MNEPATIGQGLAIGICVIALSSIIGALIGEYLSSKSFDRMLEEERAKTTEHE